MTKRTIYNRLPTETYGASPVCGQYWVEFCGRRYRARWEPCDKAVWRDGRKLCGVLVVDAAGEVAAGAKGSWSCRPRTLPTDRTSNTGC